MGVYYGMAVGAITVGKIGWHGGGRMPEVECQMKHEDNRGSRDRRNAAKGGVK